MKKFYAFAAAALCAFAANAQNGAPLYATGAKPAFDPDWNAESPVEFEYADGVYTLELKGLTQFKISTASGSWDDFDGGCLCTVDGAVPQDGVATPLTSGTANIVTPGSADYIVTVAGDLSTVTLKAEGVIDDSFPDVYLRGSAGPGWDDLLDEWKFKVLVEEKVFSLKVPAALPAGEPFKFADKDWNKVNCGSDGEAIAVDTDTEVFNGGNPANITLEEEFDGTIYLTLDYEGSAFVFFATSDDVELPDWVPSSGVASIASDSNVAPKYFNLQGVQVANPENGLFIVVKGNKTSKVLVK